MKIPILSVQFINVVSHPGSGQIKTANSHSPSRPEIPGSTPFVIELDEASGIFRIAKTHNGKESIKYVPMTNVSAFEVMEEAKPEPKVKK